MVKAKISQLRSPFTYSDSPEWRVGLVGSPDGGLIKTGDYVTGIQGVRRIYLEM